MKKQVYNPYLPSFEYVPDGEPHVFGDRIYIYGSHDRFRGAGFCLNDYVCYSAAVNELTEWRYEGVIYKKDQDARNQNIPADAQSLRKGWFWCIIFYIQRRRKPGFSFLLPSVGYVFLLWILLIKNMPYMRYTVLQEMKAG